MTKHNQEVGVSAAVVSLTILTCLIVPSCGTRTTNDRPTQEFLNRRTEIAWAQIRFGRPSQTESFGQFSFTPVQRNGDNYALVGEHMAGIPVTLVNSLGFPYYQGETIASEQPLQGYMFPATLLDNHETTESFTPLFAVLGTYDSFEVIPLWSISSDSSIHNDLNVSTFGFEHVGHYSRNPDVYAFFHNNVMGYLLCYSDRNTGESWFYEEQWIGKYYVIIYDNYGYRLQTSKGHGSPLLFSIDSTLFAYIYFNGCEGGFNGPHILEINGNGLSWSYYMGSHMTP